MNENKESYRNVVKTTTLFGGVQVIQILVSLIRGKVVAVLLGTAGMGVNNLIVGVVNMMAQVAGLGLSFSAVRDIAQATEQHDAKRLAHTVGVIKKWLLLSALIGLVGTVLLAPLLSRFSFGSTEYAWSFVLASLVVALTVLGNGNVAILQGIRRLKFVARASLVGSIGGVVAALPLYWLYGEKGIVPALIIGTVCTFLAGWYYVRQARIPREHISVKDALEEGKEMVKLGIVSMISGLLGALTLYVINSFIITYGSIDDVGLYSAAVSISNQYVGVLFTAMAVDYFPRLSAVCNDVEAMNKTGNQQGEVVVLLAAPLLMLMMFTAPLLIRILLSAEFLVIKDFICWVAFGLFFKAASFPLGYMAFAKGDKKMYFWLEGVTGNVLMLVANMIGYVVAGLTGLAVSFLMLYGIFFFIYWGITSRRYSFVLNRQYLWLLCRLLCLVLMVFVVTQVFEGWVVYVLGAGLFVVTVMYCYRELNARIGIREMIQARFGRQGQ